MVLGADPHVVAERDRRDQQAELLLAHRADGRHAVGRQAAATMEVLLDRRRAPRSARPAEEDRREVGRLEQAALDQPLDVPDRARVPGLELELDPVAAATARRTRRAPRAGAARARPAPTKASSWWLVMIEIMSARFSNTSMRSGIGRLDIPHWTISPVSARSASMASDQYSSPWKCRIEAPACSQRAASSTSDSTVARIVDVRVQPAHVRRGGDHQRHFGFTACGLHDLVAEHADSLDRRPRRRRPGESERGGSMNSPQPSGVPVSTTSPGSSVKQREQNDEQLGHAEDHAAVVSSCMSSPFTRVVRRRSSTGPSSSGVTTTGPSGQKVSKLLPRVHCPSRELHVAGRDVVRDGVAEDVVERVVLGDVPHAAPDHDRQLDLPVDSLGELRGRRRSGRTARSRSTGTSRRSAAGLGRLDARLVGVHAVVQARPPRSCRDGAAGRARGPARSPRASSTVPPSMTASNTA